MKSHWTTNNCNTHILPNISKGKNNQKKKLDQSIENSMGNISFEKSYTKCGGEATLGSFNRNSKLRLSLHDIVKCY